MELCNDVVTLYNARYDREADKTVYVGTVLRGVHVFRTMKSSVSKDGLVSADTLTVRIPFSVNASGKEYADPDGYASASNVSGMFTLNEGDYLIPDAVLITNPTVADLKKKHAAVTILGVTDNRSAPRGKHWKVVGA